MAKAGGLLGFGLVAIILASAGARAAGPADLAFPPGFRWCVATAAHQIEGGNTESDWWDWEQQPGRIKHGDRSGAACDHWNRLGEDTQLMKRLNVGTYRFSVEWAKLEPREGEFDAQAARHYVDELQLLRAAGIEPMITLHHFTLPRWVREKGGWEWAGAPAAFARYTEFVYGALGGGVRDWITVNEPMVHLLFGYVNGIHPPGRNDIKAVVAPLRGLLRAHAAAYAALHRLAAAAGAPIRVGVAHHLRVFDPHSRLNPLDWISAGSSGKVFNWTFGDAIESGRFKMSIPFTLQVDEAIPGLKGTQDFIGVNYYSRSIIKFTFAQPGFQVLDKPDAPKTDLGWEIYPEGFYRVLKAAHDRYPGKPIFVTENGIADSRDALRGKFLVDHLAQLHRAIAAGVPVEGYCHWSLMDNFEWNEGFTPRFGLYEVDYATKERRLRESGRIYSEIARLNSVRAR